ncbi:MAG: class I SAM-dependent methyltransferase [Bacteroidales bacterium]|nr:class I SAM-dependent methyltransferase [Bacteroidales bacterium]
MSHLKAIDVKLRTKALLYNIFIDPLISGLRSAVTEKAGNPDRVIDIACGTGSLAIALASRSGHVTGIDLDVELINFASERAGIKGVNNIKFEVHDASDLSRYRDKEFDIAVTSMAIHQFEEELAVKILVEMKRIAARVIISDYNYPMLRGFSRSVAYSIERMAKGDHTRNFMNYMSRGGIRYFTVAAGLTVMSTVIRGNGVFVMVVCE